MAETRDLIVRARADDKTFIRIGDETPTASGHTASSILFLQNLTSSTCTYDTAGTSSAFRIRHDTVNGRLIFLGRTGSGMHSLLLFLDEGTVKFTAPVTFLAIDFTDVFASEITSSYLYIGSGSTFAGGINITTNSQYQVNSQPLFSYIGRYGFTNYTDTSISFNSSSYVFSLIDNGSGWSYFRNGKLNFISGNKTVTLPGTPPATGSYFIYIDSDIGTVTQSTTPWTLGALTKLPVAIVVWDNANPIKYLLMNLRHTAKIDRLMHTYLHFNYGARLTSGGIPSGYTLSTAADSSKKITVSQMVLSDEDLLNIGSAFSNSYMLMYRTGTATWTWKNYTLPFTGSSNIIQYDNGGTLDTPSNTHYVNWYMLHTNYSGSASSVFVPGRAQFTTLALAQAEDPTQFDWGGLPIALAVIAYQFTYQYRTPTWNGASGLCALMAIPKRINIGVTQVSAIVSYTHNGLSGLQGGAVNEYFHLTEAQHTNLTSGYTTFSGVNIANGTLSFTASQGTASIWYDGTMHIDGFTSGGNSWKTQYKLTLSIIANTPLLICTLSISQLIESGNYLSVFLNGEMLYPSQSNADWDYELTIGTISTISFRYNIPYSIEDLWWLGYVYSGGSI